MRNRIAGFLRSASACASLSVFVATGGCLVGTLPVPGPNDVSPAAPQANIAARETFVLQQLQLITRGEGLYSMNNGKYATMDQLVAAGHLNQPPNGLNYNITISVSADGQSYTLQATPQVYGPDGQRSFFADQSGVIRGANHGGSPATAADPPAQDFTGQ